MIVTEGNGVVGTISVTSVFWLILSIMTDPTFTGSEGIAAPHVNTVHL